MFGERLRMLRTERKLTMQQMAEEFGITVGAWAKYEHNVAEPTFGNLVRMADIFEVSTDFLLMRTNDRDGKALDRTDDEGGLIRGIDDIIMGDTRELFSFQCYLESAFDHYKDKAVTELQLMLLLQLLTDVLSYFHSLADTKERDLRQLLTNHEKETVSMIINLNKLFHLFVLNMDSPTYIKV